MNAERCILHVDMDAFFASVEQRDRPELRGQPVLVGGRGPRGVVAAASYEARAFGVHSAMPVAEARRRCPQAVVLKPRMAEYKVVSGHIFDVFAEFTDRVQGLSVDEAYLDVTTSLPLFDGPADLGHRVKQRVREETGLTASVGIGPNKLVAKIASDLDKPDGLVALFGDRIRATLDPLPVRKIGGIGPRTAARLERMGIRNVRALREASTARLAPVFGRYAEVMRQRAAGQDDRPVSTAREDISISAEETFDDDLGDRGRLHAELRDLAATVARRVQARRLEAGVVSVKIRRADFRTYTRQRRVSPPVAGAGELTRIAGDLLDRWREEQPGAQVRLLGVGASGLVPATQLGLFEAGIRPGMEGTADAIRERFGREALGTARRRAIQDGDG